MGLASLAISEELFMAMLALLGIVALASPQASLCSAFLFIQSALIALHIALGDWPAIGFGIAVLLSLLVAITVCAALYFETTSAKPIRRISRSKVFSSSLVVLGIWIFTGRLSHTSIEDHASSIHYDGFSLILIGFALLSFLLSSVIILDIKSIKNGEMR